MKTLAIVIPAYKIDYLDKTIQSLCVQTNKNFVVYIGDDDSPYPIESVLASYQDKLQFVYHRFDTNIGGKSLVQQWYRCVELTTEDYIWLFSDDDILPCDAVERFWNFEKQNEFDICRLPLELIDKVGGQILSLEEYPFNISSEDYIKKRLQGKILSSASEYIFTRKRYEECGFVEFPLAWCSDDASWAKMGERNGIYTIMGNAVGFRMSDINITSQKMNLPLKFSAELQFLSWIHLNFPEIESSLLYRYCQQRVRIGIPICVRIHCLSIRYLNWWQRLALLVNQKYIYKIIDLFFK